MSQSLISDFLTLSGSNITQSYISNVASILPMSLKFNNVEEENQKG